MPANELLEELQANIRAIESRTDSAGTKQGRATGPKAAKCPVAQENSSLESADAAFKRIVMLVNASDKSEVAIRDRLKRIGFEQTYIDESVERAKACGYIDDMRFGEVLVRSRISQGKGSAGIARELADNGIEADSIPGWPYEFPLSSEDELQRALDVLRRKPIRAKGKREAAYRKLVQRGYPSSVASSAARIWEESERQ